MSMKSMIALLPCALAACIHAAGLSPEDFRNPPPSARPHTWWHWMNGNVTKEGITADLEAMARAGIGGAQIFDAGLALPRGPVSFASDAWFDCLVHADREAKRLGIELCVANCSGWTSSGGPWITPEFSMKYVTNTAVRVNGGESFDGVLPLPAGTNGFYEDIAVLAVPMPASGTAALRSLPDFDLQVFRLRGSARLGVGEGGPQMPVRITDEVAPPSACVAVGDIVDITERLRPGGALSWTAPSSHKSWAILRIGYMANGRTNRSASEAGLGLECDKLDPNALDFHFDAYVGKLLKLLPKDRALKGVLLDSYEVFGQNWTRGFDRRFAEMSGYSITNYLPVLVGYPVGSAAETERFLRDFRRVISSLFAKNYAGRLHERCRENGLTFYCEPYGNGPFNDLEFARECDVPMSEFWRPRDSDCDIVALSRKKDPDYMRCRWGNKVLGNSKTVAATAHVWGRRIVGSEAFTSYPASASGRWLESPFAMKLQCDRVLSEGVNLMIFHRFVHQPWTDPPRYPGMTMAAYGAHLERTQTWWDHGAREFFAYVARAQHMLRQGMPEMDVLLCTSGEAPDYGTDGDIPDGYSGDRCHPAAFAQCHEKNGFVVSPGGVRYRVAVRHGEDVAAALKCKGVAPDLISDDHGVTWMHRRVGDADVYFVAVPNKAEKRVKCSFRDGRGRVPELWNPVTGEIEAAPIYKAAGGRVEVMLDCDPSHSVFVVFRGKPGPSASPVHRSSDDPSAAARTLAGYWSVTFREPGAADDVAVATYTNLASWTESENPEIRYFSGTAMYTTRFDCRSEGTGSRRVLLDLGEVHEIAEVTVNGRAYPALWKPPYRVDISDAVKCRADQTVDISIRVTNLWPNRLIGDARLPDDCEWDDGRNSKGYPLVKAWPGWLLRGEPSPTGRHAFSTCRLWKADEPLRKSGLIGPVRIYTN